MIIPIITVCLFELGFIPKTEPHIIRKFKLNRLKKIPREWENGSIHADEVIKIMNDFSREFHRMKIQKNTHVFSLMGIKSTEDIFSSYIGGETGKDLLIISKNCIVESIVKRFNLDKIKDILENWKGENVVEVRTILSHYINELESFTDEEEEEIKMTGFFKSKDDLIETYIGSEKYKTLDIMVAFFDKMDVIIRG
jgi:hypothetical protein